MRIGTYPQGDVLFVEIAFSGSVGSKRRPVIILSTEAFHLAGTKIVIAGITSNLAPPSRPGDVTLEDWAQAGLLKPSSVRGLITTIDRNEVIRTLGALTERDFINVVWGIGVMLGQEWQPGR